MKNFSQIRQGKNANYVIHVATKLFRTVSRIFFSPLESVSARAIFVSGILSKIISHFLRWPPKIRFYLYLGSNYIRMAKFDLKSMVLCAENTMIPFSSTSMHSIVHDSHQTGFVALKHFRMYFSL